MGKFFDVILLVFIVVSVIAVILESVEVLDDRFHAIFYYTEWILTIVFTIEYALRLYVVKKPLKYAASFFGVIDLLSILPTYLSLFLVDTHYLITIRILRLLRIFRVFKLTRFVHETSSLTNALLASRRKISIFVGTVLLLVVVLGSLMYLVEGNENSGFDSIPRSMYWAIVTLTTVGYGDITPVSSLGQFISAFIMILGYGIIAVPTGIVTAEITLHSHTKNNTQSCRHCTFDDHEDDAEYCKKCGHHLHS
ncbi:MAG: ion transporter [Bacteroidetes bacterium]|nr:ion transporter [Bacteroidota bacterium]